MADLQQNDLASAEAKARSDAAWRTVRWGWGLFMLFYLVGPISLSGEAPVRWWLAGVLVVLVAVLLKLSIAGGFGRLWMGVLRGMFCAVCAALGWVLCPLMVVTGTPPIWSNPRPVIELSPEQRVAREAADEGAIKRIEAHIERGGLSDGRSAR